MSSLAGLSDRLVREKYNTGDTAARDELIKRGLLACRYMAKEAERSRRSFRQRPEHWGGW